MALRLQAFQHLLRMAAIPKRCIQAGLSRLYLQEIQDLFNADREMHSCRRASLLYNLRNGIRILLRLKLLIFFSVILGISARITYPALMFLLLILHSLFSLIFSGPCPFISVL